MIFQIIQLRAASGDGDLKICPALTFEHLGGVEQILHAFPAHQSCQYMKR